MMALLSGYFTFCAIIVCIGLVHDTIVNMFKDKDDQ